jgi:uncharacterized protein YhaN
VCPLCQTSTSYLSTHLRRMHHVSAAADRKQISESAENDRSVREESATVKSDQIHELAKWIYHLPITKAEIDQLRGPLRQELLECVDQKSCSERVRALLERIRRRTKWWTVTASDSQSRDNAGSTSIPIAAGATTARFYKPPRESPMNK